jgi:nicotinamide-nucleotide amidase
MKLITVALAESITGGRVSAKLVEVPDASQYFLGSIVAYSDQAKINLLDVQPATIATHGVVSAQVALEMAHGAKKKFGANLALSVTGYAGPKGEDIGLVFVAWTDGDHDHCKKLQIGGKSRVEIIEEVTQWMIEKIDVLRQI